MACVTGAAFRSAGWWRWSSVLGPSPLGGVDTIVRLFNVAEVVSVLGTVSTEGATSNAGRIPRACPARSRPCHAW
ncbi:hypothetical protein Tco_1286202 [Tanacetum coccineum]